MNWYKMIIISQETVEPPMYFDIGHRGYRRNIHNIKNPYEKKDVGYMWIYFDGKILVEKEKEEKEHHNKAWPNVDSDYIFKGRFDPVTGYLSLAKPSTGVNAWREPPNSLISKHYKKFPNIKQIFHYN